MKLQKLFLFFVLMFLLFSNINTVPALLPPPMPHYISTADDLKAAGYNSEADTFILMNDIEIADTVWRPIGSSNKPFSGTFEGNNYTITFKEDVILQQPINTNNTDGYGFFGNVHRAEIRDLNLVFCGNVTNEGFDNTGALVGQAGAYGNASPSLIVNCTVQSQGHFIFGENNVSGLAGSLVNGVIENSSSDFSVIAGKDNAGGLAGYVFIGKIDDSSASGSVEAKGENAGGVVGYFRLGNISNSSATGSVKSEKYAGGFIGYISSSTNIENSSANGSVNPSGKFGIFVGGWDEEYKPTVTNSFYQDQEVDLTNLPDDSLGTMPPKDGFIGSSLIFWIIVAGILIVFLVAAVVYSKKKDK